MDMPEVDLAYDFGCFHLLARENAQKYIEGLAALLKKDGIFILKAFTPRQQGKRAGENPIGSELDDFTPRQQGKRTVGLTPQEIEKMFAPSFKVEKTSDHSYWRYPATWYWMRRL